MLIKDLSIPTHSLAYIESADILPTNSVLEKMFLPLREHLVREIDTRSEEYPHINFDIVAVEILRLLQAMSDAEELELRKLKIGSKPISANDWNSSKARMTMMLFLWYYPHFSNLMQNIHLLAPVCVRATEVYLGIAIKMDNFVSAKAFIDKINRHRWQRPQNQSERQSGVSNLGGVSELLLEKALAALIDGKNFFKTNNSKIKSYGDFVLMCLPNNLWLSVKSNFARERLLASGYTTDILGVGFFVDEKEFTSKAKIRNFQRVGFLGMYLPDIPITEQQIELESSTYSAVVEHYDGEENLPMNINGTKFLRPLTQLYEDMNLLLQQDNIANRTSLGY